MTKKQVDNFRVGKLTPCCQLKAEVTGRRKKIPVLNHQVLLIGAKKSHNFFTLELPVKGTSSNVCIYAGMRFFYDVVDPNSQAQMVGDLSFVGI